MVCLENKNNISNAPKLKLFKNIDGTTVSEELDVLIEDLISREIIFNGDLLIMEYIESDSSITEIDPSKYKWNLNTYYKLFWCTPCGNTRIEYKNNSGLLKPKTEFRFNDK